MSRYHDIRRHHKPMNGSRQSSETCVDDLTESMNLTQHASQTRLSSLVVFEKTHDTSDSSVTGHEWSVRTHPRSKTRSGTDPDSTGQKAQITTVKASIKRQSERCVEPVHRLYEQGQIGHQIARPRQERVLTHRPMSDHELVHAGDQ